MEKSFLPTRLYIKRINNLWYFGKSTALDVYAYTGSGKIWRDKIKKYGKESIVTEWVSDWYYDAKEINEIALAFSIENDIVSSSKWANLKLENGLDGGSYIHTKESKQKISISCSGQKRSDFTKQKLSDSKIGKKHPLFTGYYITPWGKYESSYDALSYMPSDFNLSQSAIHKYCKVKCDMILSKNGMIPPERWGKTPRELGFWFEPKT